MTGLLATNPQRLGKPLRNGLDGVHGARRGDYRALYQVIEADKVALVVRIDHRGSVYKTRWPPSNRNVPVERPDAARRKSPGLLVGSPHLGGGFDRMSSFTITTDLTLIDLAVVHRWLSTDAFWALGRSRETVELAASLSLNFGAIDADGRLVGYARVVTDCATFAWLCDVYVPPQSRGHGLGLGLARAVVEALQPMGMKRVLLSTRDAQRLYKKVGFADFPHPERLMLLLDHDTSR